MGTKFSCLTLQWVSSFASKYVWKNSGVRGLRLWPGGVSPEWKQQIVIRLLRFPLTSSYKHYLVSMELDQRIFGSLMRLFPSVMRPFNLISRWENREGESDFPSHSGAWWQVDWTLTCAFIWLQISCVPGHRESRRQHRCGAGLTWAQVRPLPLTVDHFFDCLPEKW